MKSKAKRANKGFTLIEMMIGMAILAIVMLGVLGMFAAQNRSFRTTSDVARGQYNLRIAMFNIVRDIRKAGYTGIPIGFDRIDWNLGMKPLSPVDKTGGLDFDLVGEVKRGVSAGNQFVLSGNTEDAIDIWANFTGETADLVNEINAGATSFDVTNGDIFLSPHLVETVLISSEFDFELETHTLFSVTLAGETTNARLVLGEAVDHTFYPGATLIAPVIHRRYFLEEKEPPFGRKTIRTLIRRDYYAGSITIDTEIARHIHKMRFRYMLADYKRDGTGIITGETQKSYWGIEPANPPLDSDHSPLSEPWQIRAVTVSMASVTLPQVSSARGERRPVFTEMSQVVRTRNIGLVRQGSSGKLPDDY